MCKNDTFGLSTLQKLVKLIMINLGGGGLISQGSGPSPIVPCDKMAQG